MSKELSLRELLEYTVSHKASDLHIGEKTRASIRVDGDLEYFSDTVFSREQILKLIRECLPENRFEVFKKDRELDFSFGIENLGRFRANLFYQREAIGCAIRALPTKPMTFEEVGLPVAVAESLVSKPTGLILLTGATGSGKTTTLASMIDYINQNDPCHIVTIEDPIEFVCENKKSKIDQREVGSDTHSFNEALRHVLRQDPDVILIGEMRDLETIATALMVAETGHLVFATLHTPDTVQSVNRIIDVFPAHQQQQIRVQLSFVLQAIISQQLLKKNGGGLALAAEILLMNPAIRNLIRESKSHQIYSSLQMGQKEGMKTFNMSLVELVKAQKVSREMALERSPDISELEKMLLSK